MKPFDLEAALRGAPVVTRNGREVTQLTRFYDVKSKNPLRGVVLGDIYGWPMDGAVWTNGACPEDLFMADTKDDKIAELQCNISELQSKIDDLQKQLNALK